MLNLLLPRDHAALPCLVAGLLTAALSPACQADAPQTEAPSPAEHPSWSGLGSASLALNSGSSDSASALINLDLSRKLSHSKTSLVGSLNYSAALVDGRRETTTSKWLASIQQDRDINAQWFAFAKGAIDGDRMLELTRRIKLSTGAGYHLIATDDDTFDVFGGFSYGDRRYRTPQTLHGRTSDHFQRPGAVLGEESSHQLSETVTLRQRLEAYPDFSAVQAHSASFTGSLGVSMTRRLSLSISLTSSFNQYVPPGVSRLDTALFTGLSLKLGD